MEPTETRGLAVGLPRSCEKTKFQDTALTRNHLKLQVHKKPNVYPRISHPDTQASHV